MKIGKTIQNRLFLYAFSSFFCLISYTYAWNNDKFIDETFWSQNPNESEIIDALYGSDGDSTAYTLNWSGYDGQCSGNSILYVDSLPNKLSGNTVYILSSDLELNEQINFSKCSAVIGTGKINIVNNSNGGNVFYIDKGYSIIDNILISGNSTHYGIRGENSNNITINNISVKNLAGGIVLHLSNNNYINNITIENNTANNYGDGDGLIIWDGDYNIVKNIVSQNNYYGIQLYDGSDNNIINNAKTYDNNSAGVFIVKNCNYNDITNIYSYNNGTNGIHIYSSNNKINNIFSYSNGIAGTYIKNSSSNTLNNLSLFNNALNGLEIENSSKNSINNASIFRNGDNNRDGCGINFINGSNNNIINNSIIHHNFEFGICTTKNINEGNIFINLQLFNNKKIDNNLEYTHAYKNNKYYGITKIFNNIEGELIVLEKGDQTGSLPEGQLTGGDLSRDMITNPTDGKNYLLNWSQDLGGQVGINKEFNNNVIAYSYGAQVPIQSKMYVWSGDKIIETGTANNHYIGSNTQKVEGKLLTNQKFIAGISTNENINKWIYLNTPGISGEINTYKSLEDQLTKSRNSEPMIGQFVIKGGNYMHTIAEEDTTAPTCDIKYNITKSTTSNVIANLTNCSEDITGTELSHTFTTNGKHTFIFHDTIGNTGTVIAEVTRIYKATNNGGGGSTTSKDNCLNGDYSDSYYDGTCGTKPQDSSSQAPQNDEQTSQNYEGNNELQTAYEFAYENKITTMDSIEKADMEGNLTRIAMAKMLSKYATNVLGKKPANKVIPKFSDITEELDAEYDYGVSLAYQLGIMGINMPDDKFRPFDLVTRAEFVTALSRMRYGTSDGEYVGTTKFYKNHMELLNKLGIISITDPDMEELRGYVMLMLMRSYLGIDKIENDNIVETKYNEESSQQINKYFTEPYRKGQIYKKIGDLQDLLRYLGFYKGKSNSVYNKATINAVYNFQIAMGLIDINDINNPAKGYLGPATRKALNEKRVEFQLNNK